MYNCFPFLSLPYFLLSPLRHGAPALSHTAARAATYNTTIHRSRIRVPASAPSKAPETAQNMQICITFFKMQRGKASALLLSSSSFLSFLPPAALLSSPFPLPPLKRPLAGGDGLRPTAAPTRCVARPPRAHERGRRNTAFPRAFLLVVSLAVSPASGSSPRLRAGGLRLRTLPFTAAALLKTARSVSFLFFLSLLSLFLSLSLSSHCSRSRFFFLLLSRALFVGPGLRLHPLCPILKAYRDHCLVC